MPSLAQQRRQEIQLAIVRERPEDRPQLGIVGDRAQRTNQRPVVRAREHFGAGAIRKRSACHDHRCAVDAEAVEDAQTRPDAVLDPSLLVVVDRDRIIRREDGAQPLGHQRRIEHQVAHRERRIAREQREDAHSASLVPLNCPACTSQARHPPEPSATAARTNCAAESRVHAARPSPETGAAPSCPAWGRHSIVSHVVPSRHRRRPPVRPVREGQCRRDLSPRNVASTGSRIWPKAGRQPRTEMTGAGCLIP